MSRRPKGTGSIRDRGAKYQAIYSFQGPDGRQRRRTMMFDTRTEARHWLQSKTAAVAEGRQGDAGAITVGEYLADWLVSLQLENLEANTINWYRGAVESHIVPVLGNVRLSKLTSAKIKAFLAEKADHGRLDGQGGLGATSMRRLRVTLTKALSAAVPDLLASNPMDRVKSPEVKAKDVTTDTWTPETMITFLEAVEDDRFYPLWHLACWTGLRREELSGLQWGDIDGDVLSVRRARVTVRGDVIIKGPKTAASRRTVDLDAETVAVMRHWKAAQAQERLLAGPAWSGDDWVFTNEIGEPYRPDYLTKTLSKTLKRLDLPQTDIKGLRHAHATAMLKDGTHPKIVQERLGHASIKVTLDIYSSVVPGIQKDAIEKLARSLSAE